MIWQFFFGLLMYLIGLTLTDRMVTGVIKPDISRGKFLAYCLAQTIANVGVAMMISLVYWNAAANPHIGVAILFFITVLWCWVGGTLDFLYFIAKGDIPDWSFVWFWFPFQPTTWKVGVYALVWLAALITSWGYVIWNVV